MPRTKGRSISGELLRKLIEPMFAPMMAAQSSLDPREVRICTLRSSIMEAQRLIEKSWLEL